MWILCFIYVNYIGGLRIGATSHNQGTPNQPGEGGGGSEHFRQSFSQLRNLNSPGSNMIKVIQAL